MYKKLYGNSGREQGTLRYYREKLQRRNVTPDVKHYEDCEQLFVSVGRAFTVIALLDFFKMGTTDSHPTRNIPPFHIIHVGNNKELYLKDVLSRFVNQFLLPNESAQSADVDHVKEYSLSLLRYFFLLASFKEAVRNGDGESLAIFHKVLLKHFKSDPGYNAYAIEMLINIVQNNVFLSEAESHCCKWASTANWKGGPGKNMEMDLLQENSNREVKKYIKGMGANKTDKSIERMSRAAGGIKSIIENFDLKMGIKEKQSSHSHKKSTTDELKVIEDLQKLKPFTNVSGRKHDSFPSASSNLFASLDNETFTKWLKKHQKNLLLHAPIEETDESETI